MSPCAGALYRDIFVTLHAGGGEASTGGGRLGVCAGPLGVTPFGFDLGVGLGVACVPLRCGGMPFGLCTPLGCTGGGLEEGAVRTPCRKQNGTAQRKEQ